jgi:MFS family permease
VLKQDGFDNLGFTSIAVLYLFFGIFSFFSSAIVNKIGKINVSMSIGAMCYTFWIVCFLLPSYYSQQEDKDNLPWILNKNLITIMLLVTAAINGAGAGILWTA